MKIHLSTRSLMFTLAKVAFMKSLLVIVVDDAVMGPGSFTKLENCFVVGNVRLVVRMRFPTRQFANHVDKINTRI